MFKPKHMAVEKAVSSPHAPHAVMRNGHGNIVVRHPRLPGKDMIPAGKDYVELPFGSMSKRGAPGGISGGLGPFQSAEGAERGEYANEK